MMKVALAVLDVLLIGWILRGIVDYFRRPRLFVVNFDGFFVKKPTGKVANKCMKLAWRCLLLMKKGDAIIVAHEVPDSFVDYVEKVLGFRPTIYTIGTVLMPLDIVSAIIEDSRLMEQLKADSRKVRRILQPLISTPSVFELGELLGLPVAGTPRRLLESDKNLVQALNSKVVFADWCEKYDFKTAGTRCYSKEQVRQAADRLIRHGETAVIREHISAGGLGNGCYTSVADVDAMIAGIPEGDEFAAMVGPYMELPHHVSVLFEIQWWGRRIISTCHRRLKNRTESVGGITPCPDIPGLKEARRIARKYARHLHDLGYRGIADIDFAISESGKIIVLFESNARLVLTSVPLNIAARFEKLWGLSLQPVIVEYREDPPIQPGMRLDDLEQICRLAVDQARKHMRNPGRGELIIVSPPDPETGWYSFAAVAQHRDDATTLREWFFRLMNREAHRAHAPVPIAAQREALN